MDWFRQQIAKRYEVKFRARLGPNREDDHAVRILNRIVTWTSEGIEYEPDPKHVDTIIKDLKLEGSKSVSTPGCNEVEGDEDVEVRKKVHPQESPIQDGLLD